MSKQIFDRSRRGFLEGATLMGAASLMPLAGGCDEDTSEVPEQEPFLHGVASGDPLADAVILWTRVTVDGADSVEVSWSIAKDVDMEAVVAEGKLETTADIDWTVKVDVTGLEPGTTYYYRFELDGQTSPMGRTRTASTGSPENARFAVVSCASYSFGYYHAYRRVAERLDLDAVIHLGDYIYEYGNPTDTDVGYGDVRMVEPPHETVSLEDYRIRYAHYRKDPDLQEVHRQHPFIAVWDDHELANNAWSGGAENHDPKTEGDFAARRAAAEKAYSEWMPIRVSDTRKIFRKFSYGDLVDLLMLDTRLWGRDEQAAGSEDPAITDPNRTLLGEDQEAWLSENLTQSTAKYKLLGQQVMMMPLPLDALVNTDQWDGYVGARDRMYTLISPPNAPAIENVVVLTGDIHTSWAGALVPSGATFDPATGTGSVGVEFVTPGVTSPGLGELLEDVGVVIRDDNPYLAFVELVRRGYLVLDVTPERIQGAYFLMAQVDQKELADEKFYGAFAAYSGTNHLVDDGPAAEAKAAPEGAP